MRFIVKSARRILTLALLIGFTFFASSLCAQNAAKVGFHGTQQIKTESLRITLPQEADLWCGYRYPIPIQLENLTDRTIEVQISAITEVNIFLNDSTSGTANQNEPIPIFSLSLAGGEIREEMAKIQSLRVGEYEIQFHFSGQIISLKIRSTPIERGASFIYRCWFEGSEFFQPVFGDGRTELSADEKRQMARDIFRREVQSGKSHEEARREAARQIWEKYKSVVYKKNSNWEIVYNRKKNQRTEIFGFQYADIDGFSWGAVEREMNKYDWTVGDFLLDLSSKHFYAKPFIRIEGFPEWTNFQRGPSGRWGFYDPENQLLMDHWENYCRTIAERYDGDGINDAPGSLAVEEFILPNEPTLNWFSVDFDRDGWPIPSQGEGIIITEWFQNALKRGGLEEAERIYVKTFGDLLTVMTKRAGKAIHDANPNARVCTPQFQTLPSNRAIFKYMLDKGIGDYIDAWGVHPGNAFELQKLWEKHEGVPYTVEDAASQAPPFVPEDLTRVQGALDRKGQIMRTAKPADEILRENPYMGKLWRTLIDEPYSRSLEDFNELFAQYNLDIPFWVTEAIIVGPLATNRRENLIAALREYSIMFHQKVEITTLASVIEEGEKSGDTPVSYLPDPKARQLIVDIGRAIGGAHPVEKFDCRWFVPGQDQHLDYRYTVYKLYNRGDEDIIAIWSNSGKDETLEFQLNPNAKIQDIRIMEFDADEQDFPFEQKADIFPRELKVEPLKEFYYLSVRSNQPNFGWLTGIDRRISKEEREITSYYNEVQQEIARVRSGLRNQRRRENLGQFRFLPETMNQVEDELIMGRYSSARNSLDEVSQALKNLR